MKTASFETTSQNVEDMNATLDIWLSDIDDSFSASGMKLNERPYLATVAIFKRDILMVEVNGQKLSSEEAAKDIKSDWFRAAYDHVENWYRNRYGKLLDKRAIPKTFDSFVVFKGIPISFQIPVFEKRVLTEGELMRLKVREDISEAENPFDWLTDPPNFSSFDPSEIEAVREKIYQVGNAMRFIAFRRVPCVNAKTESLERVHSCLSHFGSCSRRVLKHQSEEMGPIWSDLQMAMEAAFKAVIIQNSNSDGYGHSFSKLGRQLIEAGGHCDLSKLENWPTWSEVSSRRYGERVDDGIQDIFEAYLLALEMAQTALKALTPHLKPGFSVDLNYKPHSNFNALGGLRITEVDD